MADEPRNDLMPYGVDTIRLRISFPAAPASRGYNGRAWKMRPLRGWTGGAAWDARESQRTQVSSGGPAQDVPFAPDAQHLQGGLFRGRYQDPVEQALAAYAAAYALPGDRRVAANPSRNAATDAGALVAAGRDGSGPSGAPPTSLAELPTLDVTPPGAPIAAADPDPYAGSDLGGTTVRLGTIVLTPPAPVTAAELRAIMPHAGAAADRYVDALNQAMTAHGINTPEQRAAFLAQVSVESDQLRSTTENLNYSARRIHQVWPRRFPTEAAAAPYAHHPEALANRAYAGVNGNGNEAGGDGYRFRGRGLIQVTGRGIYRDVGYEDNPEAMEAPRGAADSAAAYWQNRGLDGQTTGALNRAQFDAVTHTVNAAGLHSQDRWDADQRALRALNAGR